jgi:hypothetical protein
MNEAFPCLWFAGCPVRRGLCGGREINAVSNDLLARSAALRADLHPTEPKTGSSGAPGRRRKEESFSASLRHDYAALAHFARAGLGGSSRALTLVWVDRSASRIVDRIPSGNRP